MYPLSILNGAWAIVDTTFVFTTYFPSLVLDYCEAVEPRGILLPVTVVSALNDALADSNQRENAAQAIAAIEMLSSRDRLFRFGSIEDGAEEESIVAAINRFSQNAPVVIFCNDVALKRRCEELSSTEHPVVAWSPANLLVKPFSLTGTPPEECQLPPCAASVATASMIYVAGQVVILGEQIGEGGEGKVYAIANSQDVCKIYSDGCRTNVRLAKLQLMLSHAIDIEGVCWPKDLAYDVDGNFLGFTMPKAEGKSLEVSLFNPQLFLSRNPTWTRLNSLLVAKRFLERIRYLHSIGVVLGDIKPDNFLISDDAQVYFVDCDSYQIGAFRCPVGTRRFTPPEFAEARHRDEMLTIESDLFTTAMLLFMVLVPGMSPYAILEGQSPTQNLNQGIFPYSAGLRHLAPDGSWLNCWDHLSAELQETFVLALSSDSRMDNRFKINHWLRELFYYHLALLKTGSSFLGNGKPQVGYDLAIVPQYTRFASVSDLPVATPVAETLPEANVDLPSGEPKKQKNAILDRILLWGMGGIGLLFFLFAAINSIAALQQLKAKHRPVDGFSVGDVSVTDPVTIQAIGEKTPEGVMAYWAFCNAQDITPSRAQFFSTVDYVQNSQIDIADGEVRERRNELLRIFGIKIGDNGQLIVPIKQAQGTEGVLEQVLGLKYQVSHSGGISE